MLIAVTGERMLYEPAQVNLEDVTLLTEEAFEQNRELIPEIPFTPGELAPIWWLKTPDKNDSRKVRCVAWDYSKKASVVSSELASAMNIGVRPVLITRETYRKGERLQIFGYSWTVLDDGTLLCDQLLESDFPFNEVADVGANDYDKSEVKAALEYWIKEMVVG